MGKLQVKLQSASGKLRSASGKLRSASGKLQSASGKLQSASGKLQSASGKLRSASGKLHLSLFVIQERQPYGFAAPKAEQTFVEYANLRQILSNRKWLIESADSVSVVIVSQ